MHIVLFLAKQNRRHLPGGGGVQSRTSWRNKHPESRQILLRNDSLTLEIETWNLSSRHVYRPDSSCDLLSRSAHHSDTLGRLPSLAILPLEGNKRY